MQHVDIVRSLESLTVLDRRLKDGIEAMRD
jgi:hypothetical protein